MSECCGCGWWCRVWLVDGVEDEQVWGKSGWLETRGWDSCRQYVAQRD